nr:unnamed protein product [Digitaria exilis]
MITRLVPFFFFVFVVVFVLLLLLEPIVVVPVVVYGDEGDHWIGAELEHAQVGVTGVEVELAPACCDRADDAFFVEVLLDVQNLRSDVVFVLHPALAVVSGAAVPDERVVAALDKEHDAAGGGGLVGEDAVAVHQRGVLETFKWREVDLGSVAGEQQEELEVTGGAVGRGWVMRATAHVAAQGE